jgi:mono/diheme cytochrome c family protein
MKYSTYMLRFVAAMFLAALLSACTRDPNDPGLQYAPEMYESIPFDPYKQVRDSISPFKNRQTMQAPPEGTIPRGGVAAYEYAAGDSIKLSAGVIGMPNPIALTPEVLEEGKVLYTRFCQVCHGSKAKGEGDDGQVAKHDAIAPPDLNSGKWVTYAPGQIYHTIMHGQGVMGSYSSQLDYEERWKVIHYVISLRPTTAPAADSAAVDTAAAAPAPGKKGKGK